MAIRTSESFVLRTYPYRESDLIVSFFTRDRGKLRGIARRARRPKGGYGSSLERLSQCHIAYYQKESRELVNINSADLIHSQFKLASDWDASVALDYIAEVSEQLLPPDEVNERHFRLLATILEFLRSGGNIWTAVTYFGLWSVRLAGFLPDMRILPESKQIADEMLVTSIAQLSPRGWSKSVASDLRRALLRAIEDHVERRILSSQMLEDL